MEVENENKSVKLAPRHLLKGLQRPKSVEFQHVDKQIGYGRFVVEPFEKGFGFTIGNALRRVLLSYIEGSAIVALKIEGIEHEFTSIPGMAEDMTRLILNLKKVRLRVHNQSPTSIEVYKKGGGVFLASDLNIDSNVEIMNKDFIIANLNDDADFKITLYIDQGRGYVSSDIIKKHIDETGVIPIDALFSPVKRVNFEVSETRVGQRTDYDKLILEVWTDESALPEDVVAYAAKILKEHLSIFINFEEESYEGDATTDEIGDKSKENLSIALESLDISVRTLAVLRSLDLKTVGDLVSKYEEDLRKSKHYSDKVLLQLKSKISKFGLSFGMKDLVK